MESDCLDLLGNEIGWASATVGFQGLEPIAPRDPTTGEPISSQRFSASTLSIVASGAITRVELDKDVKFGLDTLTFQTSQPIPEPTSMLLFGVGSLVVGGALRKKNAA